MNEYPIGEKIQVLLQNLQEQSLPSTLDSLFNILFSKLKQNNQDLTKLNEDNQDLKQQLMTQTEFRTLVTDLKLTIDDQAREIDILKQKIMYKEQLEQDLIVQQRQNNKQNILNEQLNKTLNQLQLLEDDQRAIYTALVKLCDQIMHIKSCGFGIMSSYKSDRGETPLYGLMKDQMLDMIERAGKWAQDMLTEIEQHRRQGKERQLNYEQVIYELRREIENLKLQDGGDKNVLEQILMTLHDIKNNPNFVQLVEIDDADQESLNQSEQYVQQQHQQLTPRLNNIVTIQQSHQQDTSSTGTGLEGISEQEDILVTEHEEDLEDIELKPRRKKENLDGLIQKFRLENQAFSNRVQNLKQKIDKAYNQFSGGNNQQNINKSVDNQEENIQIRKNNNIYLLQERKQKQMNNTQPLRQNITFKGGNRSLQIECEDVDTSSQQQSEKQIKQKRNNQMMLGRFQLSQPTHKRNSLSKSNPYFTVN